MAGTGSGPSNVTAMNIVVVSPVQLMRDGLAACLAHQPEVDVRAVVNDLAALRKVLSVTDVNVAVIDVSHGIHLDEVASLPLNPKVRLVALGPFEQYQDLIRHGRTAFKDYVLREATVDALCTVLRNAAKEGCNHLEETAVGASPTSPLSDETPVTETDSSRDSSGVGCWLLRWIRGRSGPGRWPFQLWWGRYQAQRSQSVVPPQASLLRPRDAASTSDTRRSRL